jgi:hypothetical protein
MSTRNPYYGHRVTYEARNGARGFYTDRCRCKGTEAAARRNARMKIGFIRIIEVEHFTREQYIACFGEGRM